MGMGANPILFKVAYFCESSTVFFGPSNNHVISSLHRRQNKDYGGMAVSMRDNIAFFSLSILLVFLFRGGG